MLLLLHALTPCLLHIYCPHPLSCCIYTALVSLPFGTVISTSFNILMERFLLPCFTGLLLYACSFAFVRAPPHFATHGHVKCTWVITRKWCSTTWKCQYIVALLVQEGPCKDSTGKRHCTWEFESVWYKNQGECFTNFVLGHLKN